MAAATYLSGPKTGGAVAHYGPPCHALAPTAERDPDGESLERKAGKQASEIEWSDVRGKQMIGRK